MHVFSAAIAIAALAASASVPLSVGGTYTTKVTLIENSCGNVPIEQHETIVAHRPADSVLTITHAGNSYAGKVTLTGAFVTTPRVIPDPDGAITITMKGQFTRTTIDVAVTVAIAGAKPCKYLVKWAGPKVGMPNLIP